MRTILRVAGRENAHLSFFRQHALPTITPYLVAKGVKSSKGQFETALKLRDSDGDFIAYRAWHRRLRAAWAKGIHSEQDEAAVIDGALRRVESRPSFPGRRTEQKLSC